MRRPASSSGPWSSSSPWRRLLWAGPSIGDGRQGIGHWRRARLRWKARTGLRHKRFWPTMARMRKAMELGNFLGPGTFAYDSFEAAESSADRHARRRQAYRLCARYPWLAPPADDPDR